MEEYVEISVRVPARAVAKVRNVLQSVLALLEQPGEEVSEFQEDQLYTFEEVFPDFHPGQAIQGLRYRDGLSQAQLAGMIGVHRSHLSQMENGKRPIGKEMAKRLAKAFKVGYKVFL
jgi:DNA-binding XRE family transcriptional regulator